MFKKSKADIVNAYPHIVKRSTIAKVRCLLLCNSLGLHLQRLPLTNRGKGLLQVLDNSLVHADEV